MSKELFERNVYGGKGIITAIIAGFIISLLGGSKVQIGGPTGAFIVIIYGIIQQYGEAGLIVATLMAGVLLVLLGVFKLGAVIKFIPYPIIVGFTSGIAVTIFTTQIADIFGLSFGDEKVPGDFVGKWLIYFRHFDTINWWNTIVSIVSIIIIAITPKFSKKIPGRQSATASPSNRSCPMPLCLRWIGKLSGNCFRWLSPLPYWELSSRCCLPR